MKYRMIAVDLDGTLLDPNGTLNARTVRAARAAMERGAKIVLSSGRMPAALKHIGDEIGVNAPAVCFNGGAVVNLQTGETLYQTPVPMDLARDIARAAEERGMYLHAFVHGGYIAPEYNDKTAAYERLSGVKATVVNRPVSEAMDEAPMKLLIIDTPEGAEAALPGLQAQFAGRATIMRSQKHLIECVDVNTGKAGALSFLAKHLGLTAEEAISFGDGQNDLDMLLWSGESYVMDNAKEALKKASPRFKIAPSNAEQGVAQVIERLIAEDRIGV